MIRGEFTKQAALFSASSAMTNEGALALLVAFAGASAADTVLDVACGPGIVACAFAEVVDHATGIDLTPAMVEQARALQARKRLTNVTWAVGDITPLPYADESFSIVTSRYAFHHFPDPHAVLLEMKRGGDRSWSPIRPRRPFRRWRPRSTGWSGSENRHMSGRCHWRNCRSCSHVSACQIRG